MEYLSDIRQYAGYHRSSRTIYVFWSLHYLYQLLQKNLLQRQQNKIDTQNSSTMMYKLIT